MLPSPQIAKKLGISCSCGNTDFRAGVRVVAGPLLSQLSWRGSKSSVGPTTLVDSWCYFVGEGRQDAENRRLLPPTIDRATNITLNRGSLSRTIVLSSSSPE